MAPPHSIVAALQSALSAPPACWGRWEPGGSDGRVRRDAASEWLANRSTSPASRPGRPAPRARRGNCCLAVRSAHVQRGMAPTLSVGRGRVLAAGCLWAWGIVGTYSSRKPPRHRNNSIPRPAGRRCPSRRCIDITCLIAPWPGLEHILWKTPKQHSPHSRGESASPSSPRPQPTVLTQARGFKATA